MIGIKDSAAGAVAFSLLAGLAMAQDSGEEGLPQSYMRNFGFEEDRAAILAMAGDFEVRFDFVETVSLDPDYELKDRKISGGTEMVRVLEDTGEFISLQHTLVMEIDEVPEPIVVKHWRQDWRFEPESILSYRGLDLWEAEAVMPWEGQGAWSQTVYQVDDSPRYAAVARWRHDNEISTWEPPASWRPLPRRDDTTREDYDVIAGVNRHTVAPWAWWHEQDNSKIVIEDSGPRELVREVGTNTYKRSGDFSPEAGEAYWEQTGEFWAAVRGMWAEKEATGRIAVDDTPEGELLYMPMLEIAAKVEEGELTAEAAAVDAQALLDAQVATGEDAVQTVAR